MAGFMAIMGSSVDALVMSPGRVLSTAQASGPTPRADAPSLTKCFACAQSSLPLSMAVPLIPKGPFGNFRSASDGSDEGWVGDRSRSAQIGKFEAGEDYLFFQGPSPQYAVQPDLPGVLTGVRTGHGPWSPAACLDRSRPRAQENLANALENPPVVQLGAAAVAGAVALAAVGQVLIA